MLFMSLCDSGVGVGPEHRGQQPGPTENILSTFPHFFPQRFCCFYFLKKDYTSQRTLAKSLKTLRNIPRHLVKLWSLEANLDQEAIKDSKFRTSEMTANKDLNVGEILRVPIWFLGHEGRCSVMAPGWNISSNIIISCSPFAECSLVDGLITFWLQLMASSR